MVCSRPFWFCFMFVFFFAVQVMVPLKVFDHPNLDQHDEDNMVLAFAKAIAHFLVFYYDMPLEMFEDGYWSFIVVRNSPHALQSWHRLRLGGLSWVSVDVV